MPEVIQERNRGGRPSKLTPEVQDRIVSYIRGGNYVETAAVAAGISKDSLYFWLKRGAQGKRSKYRKFSDAVEKALAEYEARDVAAIDKAVNGYEVVKVRAVTERNRTTGELEVTEQVIEKHTEFAWSAALERLQRRFPHKWGRRDFMELAGSEDQPLKVDVQAAYDPKSIAELLAALFEASLIPREIESMIDVTPVPALGDNGKAGD